jgi:hypothetical protein
MFCPKCGRELPELGDCPSCGQARPNLDAPPRPAGKAPDRDPAHAVGCGLGGVTIGILVGIGVGFLICMGMLSNFLNDIFKIFGGK